MDRLAKEIRERVRQGEDIWVLLDEAGLKFVEYEMFLKSYIKAMQNQFTDTIGQIFGGLFRRKE